MSAGLAGWIEMLMLRRLLNAHVGPTGLPADYLAKLWVAAASGAAVGWVVKVAIPTSNPIVAGMLVLLPYGLTFFAVAIALRIPEASAALARVRRPLRFSERRSM
jgi:hypothetical protein